MVLKKYMIFALERGDSLAAQRFGPAPAVSAGEYCGAVFVQLYFKEMQQNRSDPVRCSPALLIGLRSILVVITLAVYVQVRGHGFVFYDDDVYVYQNAKVKNGLTFENIGWAFSTFCCSNWHPVTWLSHMLDCQLFGLNPGPHHLMNVFFHLANTLLLFLIFLTITRKPWRSFVIAGIFAVHPLHVQSVAWVAERKDVLCAFFGLISTYCYIRWVEKPSPVPYALSLTAFALSLMAKPMLVTLPFLFLLLDFWPLKRLQAPLSFRGARRLVLEKMPLFALAALSCMLTIAAQRTLGAVISFDRFPLYARIENAVMSYFMYLVKAFWPAGLGAFYPIHPLSAYAVFAALAALVSITVLALLGFKKRPYATAGWLWYTGMLVPVIGIVQVGAQSMADRYTYLPLVGISFALVWLIADWFESRRMPVVIKTAVAGAMLLGLGVQAYRQTTHWKSSRSLFEHTLSVTKGNYIMQNNLGTLLQDDGRLAEAEANYRLAIEYNKGFPEAHGNLGFLLMKQGKYEEAFNHLSEAVRLNPLLPQPQGNLGTLLLMRDRIQESIGHLEMALRYKPEYPEMHCNLCYALIQLKKYDEAIAHCLTALRQNPQLLDAHYNLGIAFTAQGKNAEAMAEFTRVLSGNPDHTDARKAMEWLKRRGN